MVLKKQNIFLVGPMGAGKSTIGKMLASELNYEFHDSDAFIEERTGVDLNWIFDLEGEEGFQKREQSAIEELTQMFGIVLATGGGVVDVAANRRVLAARGIVIYLTVPIDQQVLRVEKDRKRPLLQTGDKEDTLRKLNEIRSPLYEEIADYEFATDVMGIRAIVKGILDRINEI